MAIMSGSCGRSVRPPPPCRCAIQNLSAYMLKMAMNGFIIQLDMSDMKEVLRLMKINSNNLNQYAKKANETGSIYKEDIKELMATHKELLQMLGEILERLGSIE